MDTDTLKARIIEALKKDKKSRIRRRQLYKKLNLRDMGYEDFKVVLDDMENRGEIQRMKGRRFALPESEGGFTGTFTLARNGGGRIRTGDGERIPVLPRNANGALTGDTVRATMLKRHREGMSPTARITAILERSTQPVVGVFRRVKKVSYLEPRDKSFRGTMVIINFAGLHPKEGDLVVARINEQGTEGFSQPVCTLVEILGDPDSPGVDVLAIARRYQLPIVFPEPVLAEAEALSADIDPTTIAARRDIRDLVTITIDPVDARDFDDAVSLERRDNGTMVLGVHIADVAHYVTEGSALDEEAKARALSCYLVDRVIPMLPERLSNDLCSLRPNEDRLTKSVFAVVDAEGKVLSSETADTVIHSNMRLTYEQAQAHLEGSKDDGADAITPEVAVLLDGLEALTDLFIELRNKRGALNFNNPESHVYLDDEGRPKDIVRHEQKKAHLMVEEAMILANTVVAKTLAERDAPFLYRIHEAPEAEKLKIYAGIVEALGHTFSVSKALDDHTYIQAFLESIKGTVRERALNIFLLRSMKRAVYSPNNRGHFGLALKNYGHFTSPIRRYPDLIVHRQLDNYVHGDGGRPGDHDIVWYEELGDHVTEREINADGAERDSVKMKAAEFMKERLGEDFNGTISSILPIGFFVEIDDFFVEGLVHVSNLANDYYDLDRAGVSLVGKRTRRKFTLGDRVRVKVAAADKERMEIDFMLVKLLK
jgi:ribonuclease R